MTSQESRVICILEGTSGIHPEQIKSWEICLEGIFFPNTYVLMPMRTNNDICANGGGFNRSQLSYWEVMMSSFNPYID